MWVHIPIGVFLNVSYNVLCKNICITKDGGIELFKSKLTSQNKF